MKTTKLSKNFAALCLSVAAFCATQGALAEVVVPKWQNSFTTAPAEEFYLYNTAQSKFATNSFTLCASESSATLWKYSGNNFSTNGQYLTRSLLGALQFGNSGTQYPLEYNDGRWGMYYSSWGSKYYIYADPEMKFGEKNASHYDWYFISNTQFANHAAIVAAKDGEVFAEANQLLETAEEGDAKTALVNAINTAETAINGVNIEDASALTTINTAVAGLSDAIKAYKQSDLGQYVEALQATLNDAEGYEGPKFGFIEDALSAANAALNANPKVADDLDDANTQLLAALELATTILADEAYATYLANIAQVEANSANTGEFIGYAAELTSKKSNAEARFLAITSVAGLSTINSELKNVIDSFAECMRMYEVASEVASQAIAVGYDEAQEKVNASGSDLLTTIDFIRSEAIKVAKTYCETHTENVDMTIFINNNSFELGDTTGWTIADMVVLGKEDDTEVKSISDQDYQTENADGGYIYNTYYKLGISSSEAGRTISQELTNLPNGHYRLEALLTSNSNITTYLSVNSESAGGVKSPVGKTKFENASCDFYVYNHTVTIGAIGESVSTGKTWFRADNFRLKLLSTNVAVFNENDDTYAYRDGEILGVRVNREIPNNQWTTLCLPVECDKPAGLTLYEVSNETMDGEHVSIAVTASSDKKIAAGKPYIVKNSKNTTGIGAKQYDIHYFVATNTTLEAEPTPEGEYIPFTGLFSASELNAGDIYVSTSTDASAKVPVYKELSESATNKQMKGFRAYFKVTDGASSNVRFITDEVITSIMQAIEDQQVANGTYDLSGRKAATLQKGTYVIDGKKVIIK